MNFLLVVVLLMSTVFSGSVFANNSISVEIDGQRVNFSDQQPVIIDNRTLVSVRGVFETLGYNVSWEQSTNTATLSNGVNTVLVTVGNPVFIVNGKALNLDVPAQLINGRTMLPFRAVLESIGYSVNWDGVNSRVLVSTGNSNTSIMVYYSGFPTVLDFMSVIEYFNYSDLIDYSLVLTDSQSYYATDAWRVHLGNKENYTQEVYSYTHAPLYYPHNNSDFTFDKGKNLLYVYIESLLNEGFIQIYEEYRQSGIRFDESKFIHIYKNPGGVLKSMILPRGV